MTNRFLLDVAPTGVEHYATVEDDGDTLILEEYTPTHIESEILDSCARVRQLHQAKGRHLQFAARIPINTYELWRQEWAKTYAQEMTWQQFEVMKLNSRDNQNLRVGRTRGRAKKL